MKENASTGEFEQALLFNSHLRIIQLCASDAGGTDAVAPAGQAKTHNHGCIALCSQYRPLASPAEVKRVLQAAAMRRHFERSSPELLLNVISQRLRAAAPQQAAAPAPAQPAPAPQQPAPKPTAPAPTPTAPAPAPQPAPAPAPSGPSLPLSGFGMLRPGSSVCATCTWCTFCRT